MLIIKADRAGIELTVSALSTGKVIAYPTETLYGLGCLADNYDAVERIYELKGREKDKPLPLLAGSIDMVKKATVIPDKALPLIEKFWPGPLTLVLKAKTDFPPGVVSDGKIAIRCTSHKLAAELSNASNRPLVATSANLAGQKPTMTATEAAEALVNSPPDIILDGGPSPGTPPSTIIDMTADKPRILRIGVIPVEMLNIP